MQRIIHRIEALAEAESNNPLFLWLGDESVPARERMATCAQQTAFFAMGFSDLNRFAYPYPEVEARTDPRKMAINRHAQEDGGHWRYFLSDLKRLGVGDNYDFRRTLAFLWGSDCQEQRRAIYRISQLVDRNDSPLYRYAIMECIEIFGKLLLERATAVATKLHRETATELVFFGPFHLALETGHLVNQTDETDSELWAVELDPELLSRTMAVVEEVCTLLAGQWAEVGTHARATRASLQRSAGVVSPPVARTP
ncbi:MAG: hypothetical protein AAGE01_14730 [Pseudomonadota bacterium]